jgi:hypothetical protein
MVDVFANDASASPHRFVQGILKSMRVKSLPSAFVWSWTGELLVNGGHVEQGEQVIEGELAKMPRVAIHLKGSEKGLPEAERFVRAELNRAGKLQAEATAAEVKAIEAVQRASMGTERDEKAQYAIGKTLGANSILTLSVGKSASTSSESFVDRDTGIIETHVRSYGTRSRQGLLGSSPPLRARRGTRHLARCYGQVRRRDPKRRSLYVQCTHTSNYEATSVPIFVGAPGVRARPHP